MPVNIKIFNSSSFKYLPKNKVVSAVKHLLSDYKVTDCEINIVYLDDKNIKPINKQYLNHNRPTDVISFTIETSPLTGEIYMGVETAKKQSMDYKVSFTNEILRLAVHGCLHILGYDDSTEDLRHEMHLLEDKYINILNII
jgi:probable rRNA maturation factor